MFEAVAVPSVMMMTSIVCEESLARNRKTDRHTHIDSGSFILNFFKVRLWKQNDNPGHGAPSCH